MPFPPPRPPQARVIEPQPNAGFELGQRPHGQVSELAERIAANAQRRIDAEVARLLRRYDRGYERQMRQIERVFARPRRSHSVSWVVGTTAGFLGAGAVYGIIHWLLNQ